MMAPGIQQAAATAAMNKAADWKAHDRAWL
jgi:hypothetical protein